MTPPEVRDLLDRGRTEIRAARSLSENGFHSQSISNAYYGAFFSAEGALLALGETRSKHSGVISAFGQLVIKEGGFKADVGLSLRRLFQLRNEAVYDGAEVDVESARSAIADAERFVAAVEAWLEER